MAPSHPVLCVLDSCRAAFYITPSLGLSLPWGMGGGHNPDATTVAANKAGALNRQVLEGSI